VRESQPASGGVSEPHERFDTGLRADELDPERPAPLETPWGTFALFVEGGEVLCVQAFCPHLEGPLFQGTVAAGTVVCPWHFWRFDLRTGERLGPFGTKLPGRLRRCEVEVGERGTLVLARPG
jgi:nitrite reductase/ring-hydroxylating ferredoxin subunit